MMTYHDVLRKHLKAGVVTVEFIKRDGTLRRMLCTLKEDLLPDLDSTIQVKKPQSDHSIIVYDLEKEDWRRINPDTITLWQVKSVV